jgi:putative transposase
VTRGVNARRGVYGPLWQGRYRAKLVQEQRYLDQLLVYVHLNPVSARAVDDPADYRWSGHREVLGLVKKPIVDVDEVLGLFGTSRRSARSAYARQLKGAVEAEWIGEEPGRLPWWRLGRPPAEEDDPETAVRAKREREAAGPDSRPGLSCSEYLALGAAALGLAMSDLRCRQRGRAVVRGRELLAVVGVERYGLRVLDIAEGLGKSQDAITKAIARGSRRRREDPEFRAALDLLDSSIAQGVEPRKAENGGMA